MMNSPEPTSVALPAAGPGTHRRAVVGRAVVSKVPVVTASFWVLKILTTGMGEAASDALVRWGGGLAVAATGAALVVSFVAQFRARGYRPVLMHSAHDIADPSLRKAVADYLQRERAHVAEAVDVLDTLTPFRRSTPDEQA